MKRKWQISDISQLNLLPFRDKNDEEKGTGLDFIFEPRNDPSSWLQNASKICCINITISFAAVVSSLVRWPKVAMQSVTLQENPSGLKKKKILQMLFDAPIYHCTTLLKFFTYDAKQNHNVKGSLHLNTFHKSVSVGTISQIALLHKRRLMWRRETKTNNSKFKVATMS